MASLKRDLEESLASSALAEVLFYRSFDSEKGIFYNERSIGFVMEVLPLVGGNIQTLLKEGEAFFGETLPVGSSFQVLLWADHRVGPLLDYWKSTFSIDGCQKLSSYRCNYLANERGARTFRCFISVSMDIGKEAELLEVRRKAEILFKMLTSCKILDPEALLELLRGVLGHPSGIERRREPWDAQRFISEQVAEGNWLEAEDNGIRMGRGEEALFFKSYSVTGYPAQWHPLMMQDLIGSQTMASHQIRWPFFLHYAVQISDQAAENRLYAPKAQLIEKQGRIPFLRRQIPSLAEEYEECGRIRGMVAQGSRFVRTSFIVGVWSREKEVDSSDSTVRALFRSKGFRLSDNRWIDLPVLLSSLPMGWGHFGEDLKRLRLNKLTLSSEPSHFLPIQGEWGGFSTPGMLLVGRRGQLLNWDPFSNSSGNYNVVVTGKSGSGKSVFLQDMLVNGYARGGAVFVLEVGRSFDKLCSLLKGKHLTFDGKPICLNPWPLVPVEEVRKEEREAMLLLIESIVATMCFTKRSTTDQEDRRISNAIREVWEEKKQKATMTDLKTWFEYKGFQDLAETISIYAKGGKYEAYFENHKPINLSHPFVVIELEELANKPDLRTVALQTCIVTIARNVFLGDRKKRTYICIDEAWDLLREQQMGAFIEKLARRLRKYNGSLIIGTQGADDFDANPGSRAALANSDWSCFLAQNPSAIERLAKGDLIPMNEGFKAALSSVQTVQGQYSEVLILDAKGGYSISRLELDPFSKILYSSKAEDFSSIQSQMKNGLTTEQAIECVLAERAACTK
jgi:conjugal transfer ATP-binding protein TraC